MPRLQSVTGRRWSPLLPWLAAGHAILDAALPVLVIQPTLAAGR